MANRRLQNWIESFMHYTKDSEAGDRFRAWTAITTIASCMKRRSYVNWDKQIYPNIFCILIGPSAARKGSALGFGLEFLEELGVSIAAESTTRERLIQALGESQADFINPVTNLPETHCSMVIYNPEIATMFDKNAPRMMGDLCDWFDCRSRFRYETKNMGKDHISNVWVTLMGGTTPENLRDCLPPSAISGGFTSRCIFVYASKRGKAVPLPRKTPLDPQLFDDLIYDLSEISLLSGEFSVTDGFEELWEPWYTGLETNPPFLDPKFTGYVGRLGTHMLKLCMVLSVARDDQMILDKEILTRGIEWLEWTEKVMHLTYRSYGANMIAGLEGARAVLRARGKSVPMTMQDLYQHVYIEVGAWQNMSDLASVLINLGEVTCLTEGNKQVLRWTGKEVE